LEQLARREAGQKGGARLSCEAKTERDTPETQRRAGGGETRSRGDGALGLHRRISISFSNAALADSSEANRASKSSHSYVRAEIIVAQATAPAQRSQETPTISPDGDASSTPRVVPWYHGTRPLARRPLPHAQHARRQVCMEPSASVGGLVFVGVQNECAQRGSCSRLGGFVWQAVGLRPC
jgi:hypothetical protein